MACVLVDGHEVPLILLVDNGRCARVLSYFLHVCFRFIGSSIYIEEERKLELGDLQQSIPISNFVKKKGTIGTFLLGIIELTNFFCLC